MEDNQGQQASNLFAFVSENAKQLKEKEPDDLQKLKNKRDDIQVNIRRNEINKILNKRRFKDNIQTTGENQGPNIPGQKKIEITDQQLKQKIDEWLKHTFNIDTDFSEIIECLHSQDLYKQHYGAIGLRKILSVESGPPIQTVIDQNLIPKLIEFVKQEEHRHLQLEAAWALTNIASGSSHQTQAIIDKGGILLFVQLLQSQFVEIAEQAIWALGNIAGDCATYRDMILKAGGLDPLITIINTTQNRNTVKHGTWALSNLCRGRPLPKFNKVKNAIPTFARVIQTSQESEVLTDATWALSYLSDGNETKIDLVLKTGVVPSLVKLLDFQLLSVLIPALRTLGNIVTGNADQTNQVLSESQALNQLFKLLNHDKKSVRREACWAISNITAGTAEQVHLIVSRSDYVQKIITLMESDCTEIKRESTWILSNATAEGSPEDIKNLVDLGILEHVVDKLNSTDSKTIAVALEAISNILKCGQVHYLQQGQNIFKIQLERLNAVDKIEDLQEHEFEEIYNKALKILENYFELEDVL